MNIIKCKACEIGLVEIDMDSFVTSIESETEEGMELSSEVKGYCLKCDAEHIFATQGFADVKVNK
jgi:hypothetical protein